MSTCIRWTCLLGLITAGTLPAAAPPARHLAGTEIQSLVEQLGDRNYALRDQAERRLRAEGALTVPFLRKAVGHKDPEIRRRALRLLPGLEHAALVVPRRVSMTVSDQTMTAVCAELSKRSGYKILLTDNANFLPGLAPVPAAKGKKDQRFSFTFLNTPFWEVIDRLCREGGLVVSPSWGDEAVRLVHTNGHAAHSGSDGAFRYVATNMQLYRNVDLSTTTATLSPGGRSDSLTFNFQVYSEPRLPFLALGEVRVEAAYDSDRNSMLPPPVEADNNPFNRLGGMRINRSYYNGGNKQMNMDASVALYRASPRPATMKTLRGVLPVTLLVEQKPMTIAEKVLTAKGKKTRIGDLEFIVDTVSKKPNNQVEIKFTANNKGNLGDYSWANTIYQRVELHDAKGQKFQISGTNWNSSNGTSVSMTLTYGSFGRKMGEPERFVFQHWVVRQHDIHFEFRDVPLP